LNEQKHSVHLINIISIMSEEQYVKSELGDGIVMTSTTPLTKEDHLRNIAKLRQIIDEKNAIHARKRNTSSQ
jgi:hypothetical protein